MLKSLEKQEVPRLTDRCLNEDIKELTDYIIKLHDEGKSEIGRSDLLKKFRGDYILNVLGDSGIYGDKMKYLDLFVKNLLLYASQRHIPERHELIEERCIHYISINGGVCSRKKTEEKLHERKSCRDSRYTLECKTLHLKIDYNGKDMKQG